MHAIEKALQPFIQESRVTDFARYFQTGPGQYAEGDVFIGVSVPDRRQVAKLLALELTQEELTAAFHHPIHEVRHVAVFILLRLYSAKKKERDHYHHLLMEHFDGVNNWDLVDSIAHKVMGRWAYEHKNPEFLYKFLDHPNVWYKRAALVATLFHLSKGDVELTLAFCPVAAPHAEVILQKAIGWVLKVAYQCSPELVIPHLQAHAIEGVYNKRIVRIALEKATKAFRDEFIVNYCRVSSGHNNSN